MGSIRNVCQYVRRLVLCWLLASSCLLAADLRQGVAVSINGQPQESFDCRATDMFPMMSVVKFPLAIVVLHRVEKGELALNETYHLTSDDLDAHTWSPMQKRHPNGGAFSLAELLRLCLCESDNNACNYLFELVGGPGAVQHFFTTRYGVHFSFRVACTEAEMKAVAALSANLASPAAMRQILDDVYAAAHASPSKPILSPALAAFLLQTMNQCSTGQYRLKGGFSGADVAFAHKTGSSGVVNGRTLAHNDIGIIQLPGGSYACVVSFIADSTHNESQMNECHSALGRRVYQALTGSHDGARCDSP